MLDLLAEFILLVMVQFEPVIYNFILLLFWFCVATFGWAGWGGVTAVFGWFYSLFLFGVGILWPIIRVLLLFYGGVMWGTMALTYGLIVTIRALCSRCYHKHRKTFLYTYDKVSKGGKKHNLKGHANTFMQFMRRHDLIP